MRVSAGRARSPVSPAARRARRPGGAAPRLAPNRAGRGGGRPRGRAGLEPSGACRPALQPIHQRRRDERVHPAHGGDDRVPSRRGIPQRRASSRPAPARPRVSGAGQREQPLVRGARVRSTLRAPPSPPRCRPVILSARPRSSLASRRRTGSSLSATRASIDLRRARGPPARGGSVPGRARPPRVTSASAGSSETWPSGATAASHWFSLASARPLRTSASSTYLLSGCRATSDSARVTTWPQRLVASKVRPSRSALRAELARRLVLYMPL